MRHIVGLLSVMLTCFALTTPACSGGLDRGIMDWLRNCRLPGHGRSSAVPRALHEKLRKELRGVIGVCDREGQLRD